MNISVVTTAKTGRRGAPAAPVVPGMPFRPELGTFARPHGHHRKDRTRDLERTSRNPTLISQAATAAASAAGRGRICVEVCPLPVCASASGASRRSGGRHQEQLVSRFSVRFGCTRTVRTSRNRRDMTDPIAGHAHENPERRARARHQRVDVPASRFKAEIGLILRAGRLHPRVQAARGPRGRRRRAGRWPPRRATSGRRRRDAPRCGCIWNAWPEGRDRSSGASSATGAGRAGASTSGGTMCRRSWAGWAPTS